MLFDPGAWLVKVMQLTEMTAGFKVFVLILVLGGFAIAWMAEKRVFVWAARIIGKVHGFLWPHRRKRRKEYKLLLEQMRM